VAAQAVKGLVPSPPVAKAYKGLTTLARATGGLSAPGTVNPGPIPTTVAAGTILALVPEAPE
jgi:hypothetical protein